MNPLIQVVKFVTFTVLGIVTKKGWDWLTKDVDPIPGTKEFAQEYRETQTKLERLNKKYEKFWETSKACVAVVNQDISIEPGDNRAFIKVKNADLVKKQLDFHFIRRNE